MFLLAFLGYFLLGMLAGFLAGLLGIGGGSIVVPGLVLMFQLENMPADSIMHMAAGTSLAAMVVSACVAMFAHLRRGIEIWSIYKRMILGVIFGTLCGVALASILYSRTLEMLFGIIISLMALWMFSGFNPSPHRQLPGMFGMLSIGSLIGLKSGMFGIGGGVISVPFLTYCNVSLRQILGVSIAISFTVAIIGSASFMLAGMPQIDLPKWSTGYVYWPAATGIAIISPIFAILGTKLSHRLPVEILRKIFAVFLLIVGLKMLF